MASVWVTALLAASVGATPILSGNLNVENLNVNVDLSGTSSSLKSLFEPASGTAPNVTNSRCKVYPGDTNWPSDDAWSKLNELSSGRLLAEPTPLAAVCYPDQPRTRHHNGSAHTCT
jgi:hypothetical protein